MDLFQTSMEKIVAQAIVVSAEAKDAIFFQGANIIAAQVLLSTPAMMGLRPVC
jgi:hypothetical protein